MLTRAWLALARHAAETAQGAVLFPLSVRVLFLVFASLLPFGSSPKEAMQVTGFTVPVLLFSAFTWAAIDLIGLATGRRRDDHDHAGK
jgi:hypothetical protein